MKITSSSISKLILSCILIFSGFYSNAQILFSKGYFIDNSGIRTECLIKNADWLHNPKKFDYKMHENATLQMADITGIQEFGIYNHAKFLKQNVKLDTSSADLNNLSISRNPELKDVEILLKVLVEGELSLLLYLDKKTEAYFINYNNKTEELIYKNYKNPTGQITANETYKQQLNTLAKCQNISKTKIENLPYRKHALMGLAEDLNRCLNSEFISYDTRKQLIHVTLKPGINYSSMTFKKPISNAGSSGLGGHPIGRIGLELEYILPFNSNKWSVVFEPSYQAIKGETNVQVSLPSLLSNSLSAEVDYRFIEASLGVRHFFFLNNGSKISLTGYYMRDIPFTQQVVFKDSKGNVNNNVKMEAGNNFAASVGIHFRNRFSFEIKANTPRNKVMNYHYWLNSYNAVSLIAGYRLF